MKRQVLTLALAAALAGGGLLAGCGVQEEQTPPEASQSSGGAEEPDRPESSVSEAEEEPSSAEEGETDRIAPDPGLGAPQTETSPSAADPVHTVQEYQERYPGDPSGMVRFYVVDSQGNPVQNARLGFTSEAAYAETKRLNAEMGTDCAPSEDSAVRIDASGLAEAGLIEWDLTTGRVLNGLPQRLEARVTQRQADGTDVDSVQWVTLTWENTVPGYTIQIDAPNAYADYAKAEDRVRIALTRDGEPASGVFVRLRDEAQKETPDFGGLWLDSYTGFTDGEGVLYLTRVPDGKYRVYAGTEGKQALLSTVEIDSSDRDFALELEG